MPQTLHTLQCARRDTRWREDVSSSFYYAILQTTPPSLINVYANVYATLYALNIYSELLAAHATTFSCGCHAMCRILVLKSGCVGDAEAPKSCEALDWLLIERGEDDKNPPRPAGEEDKLLPPLESPLFLLTLALLNL